MSGDDTDTDTNTTRVVSVPDECVAVVIGSQGTTIKKIALDTNTDIQSPKGPKKAPKFIVKGRSADVAEAERLILDIVKNKLAEKVEPASVQDGNDSDANNDLSSAGGDSERQHPLGADQPSSSDDDVGEVLIVESKYIGLVIGREGETISNIQRDSKTRIISPSRNNSETGFRIIGKEQDRKHARQLIEKLIADAEEREKASCLEHSPSTTSWAGPDNNSVSKLYKVPIDLMGVVVGQKGETIKKIMETTKTKIHSIKGIPEFTITGNPKAIEVAIKEIDQLVKTYSSPPKPTSNKEEQSRWKSAKLASKAQKADAEKTSDVSRLASVPTNKSAAKNQDQDLAVTSLQMDSDAECQILFRLPKEITPWLSGVIIKATNIARATNTNVQISTSGLQPTIYISGTSAAAMDASRQIDSVIKKITDL